MPAKIAIDWLNACAGCEISIIDMGPRLLKVLELVEFVHLPALMDHKYYNQMGDGEHLTMPEAAVGIITGSIRNAEHLEVAEEMRKKCDAIIAMGTCATHGGIPALCNTYNTGEILGRYYKTETTDNSGAGTPAEGLPELLDACYAVDEKIKVDILLPGCPPHSDQVFETLVAFLEGRPSVLHEKSVCDTCPTIREGKGKVKQLKRFLQAPEYDNVDDGLDRMRCILEQGMLCMGPVTRAGCCGNEGTPRCVTARVPCRGCYGPVKHGGNQRLDMLNALVSNGIDITSLPETMSMLRFTGGHGMLRPAIRQASPPA